MCIRDRNKEGQERYTTEIEANEMQMLGGKSREEGQASAPQGTKQHSTSFDDLDDDIPCN